MAITNQITLMTAYVPLLDEVLEQGSRTAVLDSNPALVQLVGKEFKIPKITMDGLAGHVRANGGKYVEGNTVFDFETKTPTYDRNRKFIVDVQDNFETAGEAFGALAGQFIRTKVVPELDAWRFSQYHKKANPANIVSETIVTGLELINSLKTSISKVEEEAVEQENTYLFIRPTIYNEILTLNTTESRAVIDWFADRIVKVAKNRLVTDVVLHDGVTAGQEAGGWVKGVDSKDINYAIINKDAVIQGVKHVAPKYIPAGINQDADGDAFAYRVYGIEEIYDNKLPGVYFNIAE